MLKFHFPLTFISQSMDLRALKTDNNFVITLAKAYLLFWMTYVHFRESAHKGSVYK